LIKMSEIEIKNELTTIENNGGMLSPVDVDNAVAFWDNYQELTEKLLNKDDYQKIGEKSFKKKSAWRKYATAFNISDEIIDKEITTDKMGRILTAVYTVKATAPNGRTGIGVGACSTFDKAHELPTPTCSLTPCDGRRHFSNPENDIRATAHTRAKSRAISDLIGAGEVTAEEMDSQGIVTTTGRRVNKKVKKVVKKPTNNTKKTTTEPEAQDGEFKQKSPKKEDTITTATNKKSAFTKEQEIELSKNKVVNDAINICIKKELEVNKHNLCEEVQELLGHQIINPDESQEARKLIMKIDKS
jgi:hypothetical protein